jgi:hypothetical protein
MNAQNSNLFAQEKQKNWGRVSTQNTDIASTMSRILRCRVNPYEAESNTLPTINVGAQRPLGFEINFLSVEFERQTASKDRPARKNRYPIFLPG